MQEDAYFTSVGNLYLTLIESLDLLPSNQPKSIWARKVRHTRSSYAYVSIFDSATSSWISQQHRTGVVPYVCNEVFQFGEDFTFDNVPSTGVINLAVFALDRSQGQTISRILGEVKIPISRLEENHVVTQWYQLLDPDTGEVSKGVLRMKALYVTETGSKGAVSKRDAVRVPMAPNIDRQFSRHNISLFRGALKGSEDDTYGSSDVPFLSRRDSAVSNYSVLSTSCQENHAGLSPLPSMDTFRLGRKSSLNVVDPNGNDFTLDEEKAVPAGLIDYCVILGPKSPYLLEVSHTLNDNGGFQRLPNHSTARATGDNSVSHSAGLFTASSIATTVLPTDSSDIIVWDRVPAQDLKEMELPSKVEWFACPEGPITVESVSRPEPLITTFLLNSGNENLEVFGAALHFFISIDIGKNNSSSTPYGEKSSCHNHQNVSNKRPMLWWEAAATGIEQHDSEHHNQDDEHETSTQPQLWTAVTITFLFRIEFFDEISRCLLNYYYSTIQNSIVAWEIEREEYVRLMQHRYQEMHGMLPIFESHKMELLHAIPPCNTLIEHFVTLLHCGCPTPISDLLSISIDFPVNVDGVSESVLFEAKSSDELPASPDALGFILQTFGPKTMLEIFCCILSECRILFHSRNLSNLRKICGGFRNLTYPLFWAHVYLPIVPIHLLNLVEAPVPFLLGVHSDSLVYMNLQYVTDIVIVDCDSGAITANASVIMSLPEKDDRWLTEALSNLLIPADIWNDHCPPNESQLAAKYSAVDVQLEYMSLDQKVQTIFFDFMLHLLRFVPDCLFYLNPNFPLFNRQLFLSEYTDEDYRVMLSSLTVTNAFHSFTETLHTPAMQYFYRIVDQIAAAETQVINDSRNKSNANANISSNNNTNGHTNSSTNTMSINAGDNNNVECPSPKNEHGSMKTLKTGSPVKTYLSRQVSVRSIVLDKINFGTSTTPVPRAVTGITNNATANGNNNNSNSTSGTENSSLAHSGGRGLPRGNSISRATIFSTLDSINQSGSSQSLAVTASATPGLSTIAETPTNKSGMYRIKSGGFTDSARMTHGASTPRMSTNPNMMIGFFTVDVVALRYAELYPSWLFQDHGPLNKDHFFHVQDIVRSRFRYHESIRKKIVDKRRRHWKKYMVHVSVDEPENILHHGMQSRDSSSPSVSNRREEILCVIDDLFEQAMHHVQQQQQLDTHEPDKQLTLVIPDLGPITTEHVLVQFNPEALQESEMYAVSWTISHLASTLCIDLEELRRQIEERLDDSQVGHTHGQQPQPLLKPGKLNGHQFRRNTIAANKLQKPTQKMMEKIALRNQSLDPALADFFQKTILSENMEQRYVEQALPKCDAELREAKNRDTLVLTLRHAKRERGKHETAAPIYLLNDSSFDAFSALFSCMLRICSDTEDYLNANGLLEVGSYYCRKLPDDVIQNMLEMNEGDHDFFEFLSEKIFQHPIYQNPNFWRKLLMQRTSGSSRYSPKDENAMRFPFMLIMTEVKSLLLNMHGMKVNFARSLAFIQGVAADFKLSIDEYYHMQRYAMGLWETQSPMLESSGLAYGGGGHGNDHGTNDDSNAITSSLAAATRDETAGPTKQWIKRTGSISLVRSRDSILFRDGIGGGSSGGMGSDKLGSSKVLHMSNIDDSFYYQDNGMHNPLQQQASVARHASHNTMLGTTPRRSSMSAVLSQSSNNISQKSNAKSYKRSLSSTSDDGKSNANDNAPTARIRSYSNSHIMTGPTPIAEGRPESSQSSPTKSALEIDASSDTMSEGHDKQLIQDILLTSPLPTRQPSFFVSSEKSGRNEAEASSMNLLAENCSSRSWDEEEEHDFFPDHNTSGVLPLISAALPSPTTSSSSVNTSNTVNSASEGRPPLLPSSKITGGAKPQSFPSTPSSSGLSVTPTAGQGTPIPGTPHTLNASMTPLPLIESDESHTPLQLSPRSNNNNTQISLPQSQPQLQQQQQQAIKSKLNTDQPSSWNSQSVALTSNKTISAENNQNNSTLSKMKLIDIKGFDCNTVCAQKFACVSNWLVIGDDEGAVYVADLHSANVVAKWKHGASNDDSYRGITALHVIPTPCTQQLEYIAFSGCSDGLVKIWSLPNQTAAHSPLYNVSTAGNVHKSSSNATVTSSAANSNATKPRRFGDWIGGSPATMTSSVAEEKIRLKPSLQTIKLHNHRITCFAGDLFTQHSSPHMGWIAAAGDTQGQCSVTRNIYDNEIVSQKVRVFAPISSHINNPHNHRVGSDIDMRDTFKDSISYMTFFSCGVTAGAGGSSGGGAMGGGVAGSTAVSNMVKNVVKNHYGHAVKDATHTANVSGRHSLDPCLAVGTVTGLVAVVDINVGQSIFTVEGHASTVTKLVPVKQNVFLSAGYDRMMKLWDIRMRNAIASNVATPSAASNALPSSSTATASSTVITSGSTTNKLYEERSLGGYMLKRCATAAISEVVVGGWDNSLVISASADGQLRLWDLKYDLHNPCTTIDAHSDRVTSILWNNQEEFYTASFDGSVCCWDSIHTRSKYRLQVFAPGTEGITQLHMTDFYHKVASTLPLTSAPGKPTGQKPGMSLAVPQQQMTLYRQCLVATGWTGTLKVYAHDHFVQSNKS